MTSSATVPQGSTAQWTDKKRYLWLLGLVTSFTMGGLIHALLVIALVMVLINFFSGRSRA